MNAKPTERELNAFFKACDNNGVEYSKTPNKEKIYPIIVTDDDRKYRITGDMEMVALDEMGETHNLVEKVLDKVPAHNEQSEEILEMQ